MRVSTVPAVSTVVPRHSAATRLTHWTNAVAMGILLMSGLQILNAHPAFYWGQTGFEPETAWMKIADDDQEPPHGTLQIGRTVFHTTGVLGVAHHGDQLVKQAFPDWATIPGHRDLATGRRRHFFFAWVLVVNGIVYVLTALFTGHLRRDLLPRCDELAPAHLSGQLWNHVRLRFPTGQAACSYNSLQKLAYLGVIFVFGPLIVLSGLTMSPGLDAAMPWLVDLWGGRQSARSFHFIGATLLVLFFVVHIAALLAAGVWNQLRSMITGRYRVERGQG